jgi:hypothetical protein
MPPDCPDDHATDGDEKDRQKPGVYQALQGQGGLLCRHRLCRAFPGWIAFHAIDSAFHGLGVFSVRNLRSGRDNQEFYHSAVAKPSSKFLEKLIFFIYGVFESRKPQAIEPATHTGTTRSGVGARGRAPLQWRVRAFPQRARQTESDSRAANTRIPQTREIHSRHFFYFQCRYT